MMKCDKYECLKVIGEGAYSRVYIANDTTTNSKCALKILKFNCEESEESLNEAKMLEDIQHDSIVTMLDYAEEAKLAKENKVKKVSYVAYELAEKGSLYDYVSNTGRFEECYARLIFSQVLEAIEYLHLHGISHRDIKTENIVLDSEFNSKLCDFGFATKKIKCDTFRGTEAYMAPEIHQENGYNGLSTDVFALGVLLFILVVGKFPFIGSSQNDCHYKLITTNKLNLFWRTRVRDKKLNSSLSNEFKQLVESMLASNAIDRPSLSEIRKSDWLNQKLISKSEFEKEFIRREEVLVSINNISLKISKFLNSLILFKTKALIGFRIYLH